VDELKQAADGVAVPFVRQWQTPDVDTWDRAFRLAIGDRRDIAFTEKMREALAFLRNDGRGV